MFGAYVRFKCNYMQR